MLITNSEWGYTLAMMKYTFDRFLPAGTTWRDLFDFTIVGARKPEFFTARAPFFEVATEDGLLRPFTSGLKRGGAYLGGSAIELERQLGLSGDEILYVGDHMFGDVYATKNVLRWRTALILRELEEEVRTIEAFADKERIIAVRMAEKEDMEAEVVQMKLYSQRKKLHYGPQPTTPDADMDARMTVLREKIAVLDAEIAPMAKEAAELHNATWGLLTRAGNDKSHLARQIERYADVYTSRVSNFLAVTPFVYLRSPRGSLPHDPVSPGGMAVVAHALDAS
jgi:5'-nucleotidase